MSSPARHPLVIYFLELFFVGGRDGAVVRALAFHRCCPGLSLALIWVELVVGSWLATKLCKLSIFDDFFANVKNW